MSTRPSATGPVPVETPVGGGRWFVHPAPAPRATLLLGHGAGGGVDAPDLELLARRLPARGVTVARFEQPWRTAGGRVAVPPPRLDVAWRAAVEFAVGQSWCGGGLFFGGRSAGARVACRTAAAYPVQGVVCLAFPLHLPGRPESSRVAELLTPAVPRLVLQGGNDAFGGAGEVRAAVAGSPGVTVVELPGADHSFRLAKAAPLTPVDLRHLVTSAVAGFLGLVESPE